MGNMVERVFKKMEILNVRVAELGARALKGLMEGSIVPTATINFGASIPGTDSIYWF